MYHVNGHQKKAAVVILISEKQDFKPKTVIKYEEHHVIIKRFIEIEDLNFVNIYDPNFEKPNI